MSVATVTYNVDSESDEEEDEEVEVAAILAKKSTWHLHDIVKVGSFVNQMMTHVTIIFILFLICITGIFVPLLVEGANK